VLEALERLAPAVLRHLIAYGELLCDETGDALRQSRRRVVGYGVAVGAGALGIALGCLWAIAASWDGPNRLAVVGSLCATFIGIALVGAIYARAGIPSGRTPPFERLRAEWRADLRELARLDPSFSALPSQAPASAARSVRGN